MYLNVRDNSLSPLVITHLYHRTARLGLHEEDLADVAVLTNQVKQSVAVHFPHGEIVDDNHTGPLILPSGPHHVLVARWSPSHHVHAPHSREIVTTTTTPSSSSSSHIHHVGLVKNNRPGSGSS